MRLILIAALWCLASTALAADDFDWKLKKDRHLMLGAFNNFATVCARDFKFQRVAAVPEAEMDGKLQAELLLSASPEYDLERWAKIITDWTQLNKAGDDKALLERAADALIAAERDPEAYARAERLYLETTMRPLRLAFDACTRASSDKFLGKHYITGSGSITQVEQYVRDMFASSMKEIKGEAKAAKQK